MQTRMHSTHTICPRNVLYTFGNVRGHHVLTHTLTHTHMHIYTQKQIDRKTRTHARACAHTYARTRTKTHTHTYTQRTPFAHASRASRIRGF